MGGPPPQPVTNNTTYDPLSVTKIQFWPYLSSGLDGFLAYLDLFADISKKFSRACRWFWFYLKHSTKNNQHSDLRKCMLL